MFGVTATPLGVGKGWVASEPLAAANAVQKQIHRLADPLFDLAPAGTDAKRGESQIAVNDKADELLGGALEIVHPQL